MLTDGGADLVALGKGALADHDWVNKVQQGVALSTFNAEATLHPIANIKDFEIE